jgi:hypothetical protein
VLGRVYDLHFECITEIEDGATLYIEDRGVGECDPDGLAGVLGGEGGAFKGFEPFGGVVRCGAGEGDGFAGGADADCCWVGGGGVD